MRGPRKTLKRAALCAITVVGMALMPGRAGAAPASQDSVNGVGTADFFDFYIDARSGPNGESPTGDAFFVNSLESFSGPVTCLAVSGNVATLNIDDADDGVVTAEVVDNSASGNPDTLIVAPGRGRSPGDCSPLDSGQVQQVIGGDILVVDAVSARPTSKQQCKGGGWRALTDDQGRPFRNQGQCVRFVVSRRR